MNYKEKYNEILEWARKNKARLNGVPIEEVLPELAESEDERIRKWLLDYAIEMIACLESDISRSTYDGIKGHDPEAEAELAQWQKATAYLEKQKEKKEIPLMSGDTDTYFDDLRITTKPLTSREWFDEGIKYAQRLQKGQKDYRKLYEDIAKSKWFKRAYEGKSLGELTSSAAFQSEFKNINEAFENGKKEVLAHPEKYGLCKPAEWSEEEIKKIRSEEYTKGFNDAAFGGKLKEWSVEDEDRIRQIERIAQEAGCTQKLQEEIHDWLKSLRPQYHGDVTMTEAYKMGKEAGEASHWKPSEEQMNRLFSIVAALRKDYCDDMADFLANLYADLKKLGVEEEPEYYQHFDPDC